MMGNASPAKPISFTQAADKEVVTGAIAAIKIDLIDANPNQPRKNFNDESLAELSQSIRVHGVITPITVRKVGERYELISGERRLRASKLAGLREIPAYIRMANNNESLEMALIENIQREDLNAIDVALSYQALMDACKYNQDALSKQVGKSRSAVANFLRLLNLPAQVQLDVKDNKLSMGHARCIAGVSPEEKQLELAKAVIEQDLTVRQLEDLARKASSKTTGKTTSKKAEKAAAPEWCMEAQKSLADRLHTKVNVKCGAKGKGSIVIDYASEKELQKIFQLLNE